ncbi:uncharacterized protein LOC114531600 isoform X2 [Dendronephthya gigantea]|uniref:uncharacterized protein LOC114531600 isoform X2 n=1 Tax=Dendronephthya gigantea TaxID=151771 RepID=UPI00106CEF89|nr:uncharacterized protein LOC114531600 isoform X2 [Dendronephthya gigantea]
MSLMYKALRKNYIEPPTLQHSAMLYDDERRNAGVDTNTAIKIRNPNSLVLSSSASGTFLRKNTGIVDTKQVTMYSLNVEPYSSAVHYWPLTKIEKQELKISKDECGETDAKVSDGVKTKKDAQLGSVVSLYTKNVSLVMEPLHSRCIYDPSYCKKGITIEFWIKFRTGECIISSGGYARRSVGPGFLLKYKSQIHGMNFLLSTEDKLWSLEFLVKISTWTHLMFTWKRQQGLVVYENGEFLAQDKAGRNVRHPSFGNRYPILALGDPGLFRRRKLGGNFEISHLIIWTRSLSNKEIRSKNIFAVVRQDKKSMECCKQRVNDPCLADGCFPEASCDNIGQTYPCICPDIKKNRACGIGSTVSVSSRLEVKDSRILIVSIAVGVTCVLMLLIMTAVVISRMNHKRQGEFVPENNLSDDITADPNTQEMIAASVDPAPRITDVPFKTTIIKKTTKINLRKQEQSTSQI